MSLEHIPGFVELAFIIGILVIVFGAGLMPALGETIGRYIVARRQRRRTDDGESGTTGET